jgi:hypothetical protein
MKRVILTTAAIFVAVMMVPAMAKTTTWDGSDSTSWDLAANWDNGVPVSGDTVIIPQVTSPPAYNPILSSNVDGIASITINSGGNFEQNGNLSSVGTFTVNGTLTQNGTLGATTHAVGGTHSMNNTLSVSTSSISGTLTTSGTKTMTVSSSNGLTVSGTLNISTNGTVDLSGAGDSQTVDGTVNLLGSGSTLRISHATNDTTLDGSGSITGSNDAAKIEIASSRTLTSSINIEGKMKILPVSGASGTKFINSGTVEASGSGTLEINTYAIDNGTDNVTGNWVVGTNASDKLWFRVGSTRLAGNITVSGGTLDVDVSVTDTKSGCLSFTAGTIDVASGVTFEAR